jgi:hypothetical protein
MDDTTDFRAAVDVDARLADAANYLREGATTVFVEAGRQSRRL